MRTDTTTSALKPQHHCTTQTTKERNTVSNIVQKKKNFFCVEAIATIVQIEKRKKKFWFWIFLDFGPNKTQISGYGWVFSGPIGAFRGRPSPIQSCQSICDSLKAKIVQKKKFSVSVRWRRKEKILFRRFYAVSRPSGGPRTNQRGCDRSPAIKIVPQSRLGSQAEGENSILSSSSLSSCVYCCCCSVHRRNEKRKEEKTGRQDDKSECETADEWNFEEMGQMDGRAGRLNAGKIQNFAFWFYFRGILGT